eukprot:CAMPEP_0167742080 /NCGR_PEP_ID=MMETSP0110_2-20121227/1221_1 /TAXON_ID=629695 /ORGANISM="Gymnochlora sp., Strain CCMP2014" /LENGTH=245 /DNA_ID=CAMNT_0007626219 /DNA_START=198 /DNA_END=935 /DNA_ORIENTATION=-
MAEESWNDAHVLLTEFEKGQRLAESSFKGLEKGTAATKFSLEWTNKQVLWDSISSLAKDANSIVVGICAESADEGVKELKGLVENLSQKKGRLHGMDDDGVAKDMSDFGPVYIRYVSGSGDAFLSGYDGLYRGIYFTPSLPDGEFRQYGVLPLGLWEHSISVPKDHDGIEAKIQDQFAKMKPQMESLGIELQLKQIVREKVFINCMGSTEAVRSPAIHAWVQSNVKQVSGIEQVEVAPVLSGQIE